MALTNNSVLEGEFKMSDPLPTVVSPTEGEGETLDYDRFTDILADGKYGGEMWAESEREKIRAQAEIRLSSKRNNEARLQQATDRLKRAVDDQKAIEEEFPAAEKWGKYYISIEAVNAQAAERNTP